MENINEVVQDPTLVKFERSKTDEVFDLIESRKTKECKYLFQLINRSKNVSTNDLVFIYRTLNNPEVSGQDWGNGPGSWNVKEALRVCKAQYPCADKYETFSYSSSNITQPSTEGCVARFYDNEQIQRKIEDILGMSSEEIDRIPYSEWGEEKKLSAVDFDRRLMSLFPHVREDVRRRFISLRNGSPFCMEILEVFEKNPILLEKLLNGCETRPDLSGESYSENKERFRSWLTKNVGDENILPFIYLFMAHEQFNELFMYGLYDGDWKNRPTEEDLQNNREIYYYKIGG